MLRRKRNIILAVAAAGLALVVLLAGLFLGGVLRLNTPSRTAYPVWGVDVSEYQGSVDWESLAEQGVQFAFIKATEGSGYTDPSFAANWAGAQQAGVPAGAYHFFSFDSPAATQAENFLASLPTGQAMLPPVVDVELYGAHKQHPPNAQDVRVELAAFLQLVEAECGQKPILYATGRAYKLYLAGGFAAHGIWIRDVYFAPHLPDGRDWVFWQYSDRGLLQGYEGEERYIDLNVFTGSREQLWQLVAGG